MSTIWISMLLLQLTLLNGVHGRIELEDFYPFGRENGDSALPRRDDASSNISINFEFPFFGRAYREVHISTNGIINFGSGSSEFIPKTFPLEDFKSIAVYWSDSDPRRGGDIFYRETTNPDLLNRISNAIISRFVGYRSFKSTWALISTYSNVGQYGCGYNSSSINCSKPCNATLTYQSIITSNGINSFTIFYFNELSFTSGTADCTAHAQIGFNAGDGKRFYLVPTSNTEAIANTALSSSNVGQPGLWMFSIDGSDIQEGCNDHGRLDVSLRKLLYFAREDIIFSGPCFNELTGNVTVSFGEHTEVTCHIVSGAQLQCVAPLFTRLGWVDVTLTYTNIPYTTYVTVIDIHDDQIIQSDWILDPDIVAKVGLQITWDPTAFSGVDVVRIRGVQIDNELINENDVTGTNPSLLNDVTISIGFDQVPNTGTFIITPISNPSGDTNYIQRFMLVIYATNNNVYTRIARIIMLPSRFLCTTHCNIWYTNQPSASDLLSLTDRAARINPCQPSVPTTFPALLGNFEIDSSCNPDNPRMCDLFHPGSKSCYRSTNNVGVDAVVQCCYDSSGGLMLGPPGGGTLNFADSKQSLWPHFLLDVIPFFSCCKCSNQCVKYFEKRPSIDSRWFGQTGWGNGGGDPHFKTIDGLEYTFNPVGEFLYFAANNDVIQVRISQFHDDGGLPRQASYFSAFVIRGNMSSTVQVELNFLNKINFRINGEPASFLHGIWNLDEISLNYVNDTMVVAHLVSGLTAEFHIHGGVLNVILAIPNTASGKVSGLTGNWDGIPDNDLQLPNGTWIPTNSSQQAIHEIFGMSWTLTNTTSLFTYPVGLTWEDYQDPKFTPDYSDPVPNFQCNGIAQCNYDIHVTGSVQVGLANIARQARAADIKAEYDLLSLYCPTNVTITNGKVTVTKHNDSTVVYSIQCNDGYRIEGNAYVTCTNGRYISFPYCILMGAITPFHTASPSLATATKPVRLLTASAVLLIIVTF